MSYIDFRSYSDHRTPDYHFKNGENPETTLLFGPEIEVEPKDNENYAPVHSLEARQFIYDIVGTNIYYKRDGSLHADDAFEAIGEPCSLAYHQYVQSWKHVFKTLVKCGYRAHDARNCGLHIHVGLKQIAPTHSEQTEVIAKMNAFIGKHVNDVLVFSRRRPAEIHWCQPQQSDVFLYPQNYSVEEFIDCAREITIDQDDRYYALNTLTHDPTVEFRIFKGTLKRDTFIATLQFVNDLVQWAQTASWEEVRESSFLTPFLNRSEQLELKAYLVARGLMAESSLGQLRRQPDFGGIDGLRPQVA